MASTYSDLKIELIGTGDQTGTWGSTTNNNFSVAISEVITGSADVAFSSADVTITLTDTNAAQTARNLRLNLTGTSGGARQLILGSGCQIEKLYLVNNGLADAVTVKNTTGTGIAVPAGKSMFVFNNGTNVVDATTYLSSLTLGTALPVASGGTSLTTLTANNVILGNGTSAPSFVAPSTTGNVLTSNGTTWTSAAAAAGGVSYTAVKTANYTAVNNDGVQTNTTGGAFTVTLPTSPAVGNIVIVIDAFGTWGTNNLTIDPTASIKIAGDTAGTTLVCDISGATVTLVYTGATYGWNVSAQVGGNGGTAVTLNGVQTLTNKTLTAPTIASANLTTALTLAGAAGTAGQVLTSAGTGNPTWTTPSAGAMTLISTATANNTSQYLTFTNIGTYKQYILVYNNISNNGGNNNYLQFATGSTPTFQTSGYVYQLNVAYNSTQALNKSVSASGILIGFNGTDSAFGFSGQTIFSELSNPSLYQTAYSCVAYVAANYMTNTTSAGNYQGSSEAITGIRINGGGTFVSGSASLYGLSS
jgi:hypothetical protein